MRDPAPRLRRVVGPALLGLTLAPGGALWAQDVPERHLEEVFELGGVDAAAHAAFSRPHALLVDDHERLYARVSGEAEIGVFDRDGGFLRTMGRAGEGPGEFQSVGGFGIIGDSLWARNFPTPRISLFSLDGEHVRTFRSHVSFGRRFSAPPGITGLLAGGHAYATPLGNPLGVRRRIEVPILVGGRSLEEPDTVAYRRIPAGMYLPGWSPRASRRPKVPPGRRAGVARTAPSGFSSAPTSTATAGSSSGRPAHLSSSSLFLPDSGSGRRPRAPSG